MGWWEDRNDDLQDAFEIASDRLSYAWDSGRSATSQPMYASHIQFVELTYRLDFAEWLEDLVIELYAIGVSVSGDLCIITVI